MAKGNMRYAIAIDFGGTKISGAVITDTGRIIKKIRQPTELNKGKKHILKNIVAVIKDLHGTADKRISGIGISMPGFIDDSGRVVFAGGTLSCLTGFNLKRYLALRTGLSVSIENDANTFALAEATYGAGKGYRVVLGIIWGTGIGGGVVVNRRVLRGAFGAAGEFGHMVIDPTIKSGPRCGCGQRACLEMLSSGKNIARMYKRLGGKIRDADVKSIYNSKERIAKKVIGDAIQNLGLGLATVVQVVNPEIIVIGGGVSKLPDEVYSQLKKELKKYAMPILTKDLRIVRHNISDDAGILGAASLVFSQ
ncbi:ROK family protein [Candidatus Woesearchaeota archaeon]|nr:ROK family protein [Candidatus Woesearchaeota archaeon]